MSEAQEAWRVWHLLQNLSDTLWDRYENAFLGIWEEEQEHNQYCDLTRDAAMETELPF